MDSTNDDLTAQVAVSEVQIVNRNHTMRSHPARELPPTTTRFLSTWAPECFRNQA